MGMRLTSLRFDRFRNYDRFDLQDIGNLIIFVGANGVGKTNVLEGISLITSTFSFRHSPINQLVMHGYDKARIKAQMADGNRLLETALFLEPGKKSYEVNGKRRPNGDVREILPAVSFVPDDLNLAKKSSSVKRDALDDLGMQISKNYQVIAHDFEKALRYKNKLLKDEAPQPLIEALNDTFVTCASQLYCYRHALHRKMVPFVEKAYLEIATSRERFGASYLPSWDYLNNGETDPGIAGFDGGQTPSRDRVKVQLEAAINRFSDEERRRRRALVGPHNDKIAFYLNEKDAAHFASQGQQRSIVLAWKIAEVEVIRQTTKADPVLLLDDVMSELDETRRDMLISCVGDEAQTFMTATDLSYFNEGLLCKARVVELG